MRLLLILLPALVFVSTAEAYTGPGLGLGVIGTIVGVLFSILLAFLAIFWYPLKRMLKAENKDVEDDESSEEEPSETS